MRIHFRQFLYLAFFSLAFIDLLSQRSLSQTLHIQEVSDKNNIGRNFITSEVLPIANYWTDDKIRLAEGSDGLIEYNNAVSLLNSLDKKSVSSSVDENYIFDKLLNKKPPLISLTYPFPYKPGDVDISRYTKYPERTVGKLFFDNGKKLGYCSAVVLVSQNNNFVLTAGHCVFDKGKFLNNMIFIPAYNGNAKNFQPYGRWVACGLDTTKAWYNTADKSRDIGVVRVCNNERIPVLARTVGALGYTTKIPRQQSWHVLGYPSVPSNDGTKFDGTKMTFCDAAYADDRQTYLPPFPVGIGCNMTTGSSGGPWIINYKTDTFGNVNLVNGINSFKAGEKPNSMYSPYFDDTFLNLYSFGVLQGA
jgi:V8-like Glu-specific endopeptidase